MPDLGSLRMYVGGGAAVIKRADIATFSPSGFTLAGLTDKGMLPYLALPELSSAEYGDFERGGGRGGKTRH